MSTTVSCLKALHQFLLYRLRSLGPLPMWLWQCQIARKCQKQKRHQYLHAKHDTEHGHLRNYFEQVALYILYIIIKIQRKIKQRA